MRARLYELWELARSSFWFLPSIMVLFALSFDLLLGYGGIVTLGHAAYFGAGAYTAGLLAKYGWGEPLSALAIAGVVAGVLGAAAGAIILRTKGLTLLMLGMAVSLLLLELANHEVDITGGADGLQEPISRRGNSSLGCECRRQQSGADSLRNMICFV